MQTLTWLLGTLRLQALMGSKKGLPVPLTSSFLKSCRPGVLISPKSSSLTDCKPSCLLRGILDCIHRSVSWGHPHNAQAQASTNPDLFKSQPLRDSGVVHQNTKPCFLNGNAECKFGGGSWGHCPKLRVLWVLEESSSALRNGSGELRACNPPILRET